MSNTTCPNCGAPVSYNPGKENICRYCGCTIHFNDKKAQADNSQDFINSCEFKVSPKGPYWLPCDEYSNDEVIASKVKEAISNGYGNENIDIAKVRVDILGRLYCPLVRFKGTVKAKWSCTQVIEHDYRDSYVPRNGELTFSVDMLFDAVERKLKPKNYPSVSYHIETSIIENEVNTSSLSSKPMPSDFTVCQHISDGLTEQILRALEIEVWDRIERKTSLFSSQRENEDVTFEISSTEHTGEIYYVPVVNTAATIGCASCKVDISYTDIIHNYLRFEEEKYLDLFKETDEYKKHKDNLKKEEERKKKAEDEKKLQDLAKECSWCKKSRKYVYITFLIILGLILGFRFLLNESFNLSGALWGAIDLFCIGGIIWELVLLCNVSDHSEDKELVQKAKKITRGTRGISKILILLYVICIIVGIIAQS